MGSVETPRILDITCKGTPYEIGFTHGSLAKKQVAGSIDFYASYFQTSSGLEWPDVRIEAEKFVSLVRENYPRYYEEISGIADGAGVPFLDVLALNVRSEIAFGLFSLSGTPMQSDGCTSLAWKTPQDSFISQNWDWLPAQRQNLIICRISQPGTDLPDFQMITEAGIIGKIGFNSAGVGCCLNAIRARGLDSSRTPIHFGLRIALESRSKAEAIFKIKEKGIAASAHLLIGDAEGAVGLECSHIGFQELHPDELGRICHSNHYIAQHDNVYEPVWLEDSPARTARMRELATANVMSKASLSTIRELYKDEKNLPGAINRKSIGENSLATLFNVVFNLTAKKGLVTMGRPTEPDEEIVLEF
ncbi:hypothetical protein VTO42DRAFT_5038 [Malbranchea cinnamomea]